MRQNWFVTLRNRVRDLQGCPPSGTHCAVQAHVFQPKLHFVSGNKGTGRRRCSTSPPAVRQGTAWKNQKKPCAVCWGLGAALAASQPFSLHHLGPRNVPYRRHCQGCFFLCFQAPFYCHWGLKQRQQGSDRSLIHIKYTEGEKLNKPSHLEPSFPLHSHVCLDLFLLYRGNGRI